MLMLIRIAQKPTLYAGWCLVVTIALVATYFAHPYIFAFTTLGLMWLSIAVTVIGVGVVVFARTPTRGARVTIIAASLGSLVAVAVAVAVLGTFNWA
jgi:hypothetical protein